MIDFHRTQRFKTTLANFHSYCQKQSEQSPIITKLRSKSNKDITNYTSIRQLRKYSEKKKEIIRSESKKNEQYQSTQKKLQITNADLIEIIKLKLSNNKRSIKSEDNESKIFKKNSPHVKHYGYYQFCNQTSHINNTIKYKRKKVDLVIENSKLKFSQHPLASKLKKQSQINVTLESRPYSAFQIQDFSSFDYKQEKRQLKNPIIIKQKVQLTKNESLHKSKDLSGWDFPIFQDESFSIQETNKRQNMGKKRKPKRYTQ